MRKYYHCFMSKSGFVRLVLEYKREIISLWLLIVTVVALVPIATYLYFAKDLRSKDSIMNRGKTGVVLLDRNNTPFFTLYQAKQIQFVPIADIPLVVQNAAIASEDRDFYSHSGFSIRAIIRSLIEDVKQKELAYGGSTITQQLVKNALLTSNKTILRKYQEIVLANEIERRYTKKEILEMYLNSVYFGEGAFGIDQAAETYFGKKPNYLNLSEAALLIGLLPAPSQLSPLSSDGEEAILRQKIILQKMEEQGYITKAQREEAIQQKLIFATTQESDLNKVAPHFALMVKEQLIEKYGEETISRSGFKVKTTLDLEAQIYAENIVQNQVTHLASSNVSNGAAVAIDPKTGELLVMVGSANWFDEKYGKLNIATAPRQPGSSFKPIIYAKALEEKYITLASVLPDEPTTFPGNYKPLDYDKKFRGKVLARRALANSLNIPSVEVMRRVGVEPALEYAKSLGLTTLGRPSDNGLSLVLGTGAVPLIELTNVYATFANKGVQHEVTSIIQVTNKYDQVVYKKESRTKEVIHPEIAFLISSVLSDNKTRAEQFGNTLTISRTAAVKTGTTENYRDAWTLGYTPQITVGAWVGNNNNAPMEKIAGSLGAAPIWKGIMEYFLRGLPVEPFTQPPGVISKTVCSTQGLLIRESTSSAISEFFLKGTEPTKYCFGEPSVTTPSSQEQDPNDKDDEDDTPTDTPTPTDKKNDKEDKEKKIEIYIEVSPTSIPLPT